MPDLRRFFTPRFWPVLTLILVAVLTPGMVMAKSGKSSSLFNAKYASIVLDAETGKVLSSRYPDKIVHPASLTKMMTIYMAFREIEAGRLSMSSRVVMSRHAASQPPSKVGLAPGKSMSVRDAIGVLVTQSANDVAAAMGEKISGSESAFARDMTRVAHAMGMKDTQFQNASGLPNKGQVTTARDMAILARGLLYHYPQHYHFFGMKNYSFNGRSYHNHNRLMSSFAGMDGLKTGFINDSGYNLVASAKRGGRRLIGVVFGGKTWRSRNDHMAELLNAGFDAVGTEKPNVQMVSFQTENAKIETAKSHMVEAVRSPVTKPFTPPADYPRAEYPGAVRTAAPAPVPAPIPTPILGSARWSIQVGAFSSQAQTMDVAGRTATALSQRYGNGISPVVIPFQSQNGTIYRARVTGMTQSQAVEACRLLSSCIIVQPNG